MRHLGPQLFRFSLFCLLLGGLGFGCFQSLNEQSGIGSTVAPGCEECHKSAGGVSGGGGVGSGPGGASSGAASTAGGSSGGVSSGGGTGSPASGSSAGGSIGGSSGGSSAGSSTGGNGGSTGGPLACGLNSYLAATTVSGFGTAAGGGAPIAAVTVTEIGRNGVPLTTLGSQAITDANGFFEICMPLDVPITLQLTANSYPTTYIEELDITNDAGPPTLLQKGLQLIPSAEISALSDLLGVQHTTLDLTKGIVAAAVISISQMPPCGEQSGWSVGVDLLDGGTLPDGGPLPFGLAYLGSSDIPSGTATSTSSNGYAIIFNVDPSIATVAQLEASNPDAGGCPPENSVEMLTGRISVQSGSVTFAPFFIP